MNNAQSRSNRSLWLACGLSVVGFLVAYGTGEYALTTEGYYESELVFWDYVVSAELAVFGIVVARFLWISLIKEGGTYQFFAQRPRFYFQ
jgi:hypothetical protein